MKNDNRQSFELQSVRGSTNWREAARVNRIAWTRLSAAASLWFFPVCQRSVGALSSRDALQFVVLVCLTFAHMAYPLQMAQAGDDFSEPSDTGHGRLFTLVDVLEKGLLSETRFSEEFSGGDFGEHVFCVSDPTFRYCDSARILDITYSGSKKIRLPKFLGGPGNPLTLNAEVEIVRVCDPVGVMPPRIVGLSGHLWAWLPDTMIAEFPHLFEGIPSDLNALYSPEEDPKSVYGPDHAGGLTITLRWPLTETAPDVTQFGLELGKQIQEHDSGQYSFVFGGDPAFLIGRQYVGRDAFVRSCKP